MVQMLFLSPNWQCEMHCITVCFHLMAFFWLNLVSCFPLVLFLHLFLESRLWFTMSCDELWQVFSEKMGLEAGWNCHICLRTERSNDALAMAPAGDASHGYASMLLDSLPDLIAPQNAVEDEWTASCKSALLRRIRSSSAPYMVPVHSANEPQRKSMTLENKQSEEDCQPPATFCWEVLEEDAADQQVGWLVFDLTALSSQTRPRHAFNVYRYI